MWCEKLKIRYLEWKERRFLKRHGCTSREQYDYKYDPDINRGAYTIKQYFMNYLYYYAFDGNSRILTDYEDYGPGGMVFPTLKHLTKWCDENCTDKYRFVMDNALKYPHDYIFNSLGPTYIFVGFKNEQDYLLFVLRWGGI